MSLENEIKKSVLTEINLFEKNANKLPQIKDIEILKKVRAIWVLSGSGSYLKPLIDVESDQANINNLWYHGTDKARLDYAEQWLSAYSKILPANFRPILIYNGLKEQQKDLFKAIEEKKCKIALDQVYIAPGDNIRTIDQVKNFSFPPNLDLNNGFLGILSHLTHLPRILRFMGKNRKIFKNIKALVLPLNLKNTEDQVKMAKPEVKGIFDYIQKGKAAIDPYSYRLLDK